MLYKRAIVIQYCVNNTIIPCWFIFEVSLKLHEIFNLIRGFTVHMVCFRRPYTHESTCKPATLSIRFPCPKLKL